MLYLIFCVHPTNHRAINNRPYNKNPNKGENLPAFGQIVNYMSEYIFTSESVTEGHPDKVCDQISDSVLDAILAQDPGARVACECAITTGVAFVMGEISTQCYVDIPSIVRETIRGIGYTSSDVGFDCNTCAVLTTIDEQSADIAAGVDKSFEYKQNAADESDITGAGDQGMMFGFACDETPQLMPAPISMAGDLARRLAYARKNGTLLFLRPDGKTQVSVNYNADGTVNSLQSIVVSTQHSPEIEMNVLRDAVMEEIIKPVVPAKYITNDTKIYINPTGRFVIGGPHGDSGLTGRKIIADTYGGYARHGGGAFSGKDPTKVDRSGAYMARYIAKNLVAAGLCKKCEIEVAYAIGVAHPVSVYVETFGTSLVPDSVYKEVIDQVFDLRPGKIIKNLDLLRPIYAQTASYGHFGRPDLDLPWEKTDKVEIIKYIAKI